LNAKNHEREAKTIAQAGRLGAVTIATNIAGRGVDIILGGTKPEETIEVKKTSKKAKTESGLANLTRDHRTVAEWQKEHDAVINQGGLMVIGTERHEARRIDNQLRGRAGRQGDPGESIFYVSMDDDLMRVFGGDRIKGMMDRLGLPDDAPIEAGLVSKSIEQAQKKVEGHNFDIRKHLVEYDDVMNKHREAIYRKRRLVLSGLGRDVDGKSVPLHDEILSLLSGDEKETYISKSKKYGIETIGQVEQQIYLRTIDQMWIDHLNAMEELRTGIGLQGYGQKDPLTEYKQEAYRMFERLLDTIEAQVIDILLKIESIQVSQTPQPPKLVEEQGALEEASGDVIKEDVQEIKSEESVDSAAFLPDSDVSLTVRQKGKVISELSAQGQSTSSLPKVGRNDPCPCGSGKKYKKCHGK
jgi:preprotein translocase subunit SecA